MRAKNSNGMGSGWGAPLAAFSLVVVVGYIVMTAHYYLWTECRLTHSFLFCYALAFR